MIIIKNIWHFTWYIILVVTCYNNIYSHRVKPAIQQFVNGLGDLWRSFVANKTVAKQVFIPAITDLSVSTLKDIYQV